MRTAPVTSPPPSEAHSAVRLNASGNRRQRRDSALVLFHLVLVLALKLWGSQTGQLEGNTGSFLSCTQRLWGCLKERTMSPWSQSVASV